MEDALESLFCKDYDFGAWFLESDILPGGEF